MNKSTYDVLIVGGSHAGLSAAMALGRLKRSALIVDDGNPRNTASDHANNIASMDGVNPKKWRSQARNDLKKYNTIEYLHGKVTEVNENGAVFKVSLESGEQAEVRKVILAYGVKDKLPEIEGIEGLWGKSVFHCPYCHGNEISDKTVGMIDGGKAAEHIFPLMKNLTSKLLLLTNGRLDMTLEFTENLQKHEIPAYQSKIISLEHDGTNLNSVTLESGEKIMLDALLIGPTLPFELNSDIGEKLGCKKDSMGFTEVNEMGKTTVDGVFAAGDMMTKQHSVIGAAASGQVAGSGAVFELSHEDFHNNSDK